MPRMRKGLYRVVYLNRGRRTLVPATLQFDAAIREFKALKQRAFTAWIETDSGEFVPVEGAMRKPKEIVNETRHHRVADFSTLPELIEHAKAVDGATHSLVSGRTITIFFPRSDGRYDSAVPWQERGYWHLPAATDRVVVTRLPTGAEPIGSQTQRVGRRVTASGRRSKKSAIELAGELSEKVGGSEPKSIPGGYRWSDPNEAAQFTTHSPEYGQKVVCVVSVFADGSVAVGFFGDEGLSHRYENIAHFTYPSAADISEMVKDIEWVWRTVDGYAASWQDDGEVEEAAGPPPGWDEPAPKWAARVVITEGGPRIHWNAKVYDHSGNVRSGVNDRSREYVERWIKMYFPGVPVEYKPTPPAPRSRR
jgi:hypothetical protein